MQVFLTVPALVMILGLLIYFAAGLPPGSPPPAPSPTRAKLQDIGRVMFVFGLAAFLALYVLAGRR